MADADLPRLKVKGKDPGQNAIQHDSEKSWTCQRKEMNISQAQPPPPPTKQHVGEAQVWQSQCAGHNVYWF